MAYWNGTFFAYEDTSYPANIGRITILKPIINFTDHPVQWEDKDDTWWKVTLPDLIKKHALARTLTYNKFVAWWDSEYKTSLPAYLLSIKVPLVELKKAIYWMSRNPYKITFSLLQNIFASLGIILVIKGVPTRKARFLYTDEQISASVYSISARYDTTPIFRAGAYRSFMLFNEVIRKMTANANSYLQADMKDLIVKSLNLWSTNYAPYEYYYKILQGSVVKKALEQGLKIPYKVN